MKILITEFAKFSFVVIGSNYIIHKAIYPYLFIHNK
jgi:hypothetical protein